MQVIDIDEHEDGSATINFDISSEELKYLVQFALLKLITEFANEQPKRD